MSQSNFFAFGLRTAITLPLALFVVVLFAGFLATARHQEKTQLDEDVEQAYTAAQRVFNASLTDDADALKLALVMLGRDEALAHAMLSGDRATLQRLAAPLFANLHDTHRITHLYFSDTHRINRLRVHQPERHGDRIDRATTLQAAASGKPAAGLELGPLGTFSLRAVTPWHHDGRLIGYIEVAEEIEHLLQRIKDFVDIDFVVAIDKRYLKRDAWTAGMRMLGRPGDWDRYPHVVVTARTIDRLDAALADLLAPGNLASTKITELGVNGSAFRIKHGISLADADGREVGHVLLIRDVGARVEASRRDLLAHGGIGALMAVTLLLFFFWLTGRVETKLLRSNQRLEYVAYYDELTGLANRPLFADRLHQAMIEADRNQRRVAVAFFDIDRFKTINDTLGHEAGNQMLAAIAERLRGCFRQGDTIARFGGDEFAILLSDLGTVDDAARVAQTVSDALKQPFELSGQPIFVTASVGLALYPGDGHSAADLLKNADAALFHAKEQGRDNHQFYSRELTERIHRRMQTENRLRHAVERGELSLAYQPQVDIASRRIVGVEALLRWQHPELGAVAPDEFIPVAEDCGLIVPIGDWVIETACTQALAWQQAGLPPLTMAVNLSTRQFRDPRFADKVFATLDRIGLAPSRLELEITESLLIDASPSVYATLEELKQRGIGIAIDDFGTGYSSLSYLKRFPIDKLKIDRAFVRNAPTHPDDASLVRAIIAMARSLRLAAIAEGVETEGQYDFLRAEGCDQIQGYYFGRPQAADAIAGLLAKAQSGLTP